MEWHWYQGGSGGGGEPNWVDDHVLEEHTFSDGTGNEVYLKDEHGESVLIIDQGVLPSEAHAALIAAASKLLAACKAAYERFQQAGIEDHVLKAAIFAAEPESPMQSGG